MSQSKNAWDCYLSPRASRQVPSTRTRPRPFHDVCSTDVIPETASLRREPGQGKIVCIDHFGVVKLDWECGGCASEVMDGTSVTSWGPDCVLSRSTKMHGGDSSFAPRASNVQSQAIAHTNVYSLGSWLRRKLNFDLWAHQRTCKIH